jgi:hypothetical protein
MRTPPHSFISSSHIPYGSFFFFIIAQSVDTASYVFKGLISLCTFASLDIKLDSPLYLAFSLYSIPLGNRGLHRTCLYSQLDDPF